MNGTLIDVREYPEFAAGHVEGAKLVPLGVLGVTSEAWDRKAPLTLICKSGRRAEQARQQLLAKGFSSLEVLAGGVDAWRAAGRSLIVEQRRPWSIERQVRTVAGSLVVVTLTLGYFVSRYFLLGTAFVGCGLVFAGVNDTCVMGSMLARMPWNRASRVAA